MQRVYKTTIAISCICALFTGLAGCDVDNPTEYNSDIILTLSIGDSWTYHDVNQLEGQTYSDTVHVEIIEAVTEDGITKYFTIRDETIEEYYAITEQSLLIYTDMEGDSSLVTLGPLQQEFRYDVEPGDQYQVMSFGFPEIYTCISVTESLDLPAGHLDGCYLFRVSLSYRGLETDRMIWFHPSIGVVKKVVTHPFGQGQYVRELIDCERHP